MNSNSTVRQNNQGYVLVVSLVLLLVMTIMGLGLLHVSLTEKRLVERSMVNQERIFVAAETCVQDAEVWLSDQLTAGSPSLPFTSLQTNFGNSFNALSPIATDLNAQELAQFAQYTYGFTTDRIGGSGGNDVGESVEYSGSGGGLGESNYRITCVAQRAAPDESSLTIIRELTL